MAGESGSRLLVPVIRTAAILLPIAHIISMSKEDY